MADEIDRELDDWLAAEAPVVKEEEPKKASDLIRNCIHKLEENASDEINMDSPIRSDD